MRARGAAAGDVPDLLPGRDRRRRPRPSTCRSSRPIRSPRPFAPALEIGAEIVFADPEAGERPHLKDAYPDPYAIRHIGLERYVEAYRVYPQPRSEEIARHAAGHRLEAAGRRSRRRACWWWFRSTCSTRCWTPWRSRRRSRWRARAARAWSCSIRIPNRWPKSPLEYPLLQWRYENFRAGRWRMPA